MKKYFREGAIGSLLDEYEKAINDLQNILRDLSETEFVKAVQPDNPDPDFISIQSIMAHVVRWGYMYPSFIKQMKTGNAVTRQIKNEIRNTPIEYIEDLNKVISYAESVYSEIEEKELLQADSAKKFASYGHLYDYEQLMEHAIVHILRHRRQIEKYLLAVKNG